MAQTITVPTVEEHDALAHDVSGLRRDVLEQGGTVQALTSRVAALEAAVAVWHPTPAPVPDPDPVPDPEPPTNPDPPTGQHAYFQSLLQHPKLWRDYSLRDQDQIDELVGTGNLFVTYDPLHDTYAKPHDAAKVTIISGKVNLRPYPILPIGVSAGSMLCIWDHVWGEEYLEASGPDVTMESHKQFVLTVGAGNDRWVEIRARYRMASQMPGAVCKVDLRAYGALTDTLEDGTTPKYTMSFHGVQPAEGIFWAYPNRWVRYFALAERLETGAPCISIWVADEVTDPVLLHKQVTIVSPEFEQLYSLRMQFNSSDSRIGGPDLVSYLRNAIMLRDVSYDEVVADPAILVKPTAEG